MDVLLFIVLALATALILLKFRRSPRPAAISGELEGLTAPLPVDHDLRAELFQNLQGNILSGHGRNYGAHVLIEFTGDSTESRLWLKEIASAYITSFSDHKLRSACYRGATSDGGIFGHIALSSAGYKALGFKPEELPVGLNPLGRERADNVFAEGMKERAKYLLDPPVDEWEEPYRQPVHALIILAADNQALLAEEVRLLSGTLAESSPARILAVEWGESLLKRLVADDPNSTVHVEHFGFVDGRSQPLFLEEQLEKERDGISKWDPTAPLDLVLVNDPLGRKPLSFGSFLVFRKLEQNVRGFEEATRALAAELGITPELAGAMAVGRFKDGTPVSLRGEDGTVDVANNFDFGDDPSGLKCPFHAHIRKTNPRGEAVGVDSKSFEEEKRHRIARRGMPYGGPLRTDSNPENLPEDGVGLLFFCYQSDIWEQFEFIQRRWSNNPFFLEPQKSGAYDKTGLDPVIGQAHPTSQNAAKAAENWPSGWGAETKKVKVAFANFVKMLGGEYFFSPSISFFESLDR